MPEDEKKYPRPFSSPGFEDIGVTQPAPAEADVFPTPTLKAESPSIWEDWYDSYDVRDVKVDKKTGQVYTWQPKPSKDGGSGALTEAEIADLRATNMTDEQIRQVYPDAFGSADGGKPSTDYEWAYSPEGTTLLRAQLDAGRTYEDLISPAGAYSDSDGKKSSANAYKDYVSKVKDYYSIREKEADLAREGGTYNLNRYKTNEGRLYAPIYVGGNPQTNLSTSLNPGLAPPEPTTLSGSYGAPQAQSSYKNPSYWSPEIPPPGFYAKGTQVPDRIYIGRPMVPGIPTGQREGAI